MKVKAAYKNPDEFYFGMVKESRGQGKQESAFWGGTWENVGEVIRLMKSQDLKHIQEMIRVNEETWKLFKAEHAITIGSASGSSSGSAVKKGKHVKFIEDDEELADMILDTQKTKKAKT